MSLDEVRTAIVKTITDSLGSLGSACVAHGGRFGLEEIKKIAMRTPAVLVGCLGVSDISLGGDGKVEAMTTWGTFVVTSDKQGLQRDAAALVLVTALATIVPDNIWGRDDVEKPVKIRADNLYSGKMKAKGIALWAVTWRQEVRLGGIDETSLALFETCHVDWDLADPDGEIEATDHMTLPQV